MAVAARVSNALRQIYGNGQVYSGFTLDFSQVKQRERATKIRSYTSFKSEIVIGLGHANLSFYDNAIVSTLRL